MIAPVAFRGDKGPREASSGRTGDAVGVQSIASSSSSSRERISASRDCDAGAREGANGGGSGGDGGDDDDNGWKVVGLREV